MDGERNQPLHGQWRVTETQLRGTSLVEVRITAKLICKRWVTGWRMIDTAKHRFERKLRRIAHA